MIRARGALLILLGLGTWAAQAQAPLAWFDGARPGAQASAAVALLADAASHGLDPRDYSVAALRRAVEQSSAVPPRPAAADRLQQALTLAMLRYLSDLHVGRAPPADAPRGQSPFDPAAALRAALALQDLSQAVRQAEPALPQYGRLREALARYRALEGHPAWALRWPALPLPPGKRVRALEPGMAWDGLPALEARLAALGDLDAREPQATASAPPAPVHDGRLVAAVQSFQQRHGLQADGVIGRSTWAALQVTPGQRARQLELSLERLRWTPWRQGPRMIVVNLPEFVLRAYEVQGDRIRVAAEMKVIVGQAMDKRTPLIDEWLRSIEFKPFWNVPASIARHELVPRLRREPGHWAHEGFEFVGTDGRADQVLGEAKLQAVLAGQLRIRQRPGPRNALGDIKFVFPNRSAIYLHHTPSVQLFERARRDFSHGCIRVEQPAALAAFALHGQPGWTEERIRQAMAQGPSTAVRVDPPVAVLITYGTALVKDGRVHFFDDLYGHDRALEAALRRRVRASIALDLP
ncbi:murein L,D-transpeptidase [Ideonella sp. A 288]|uniref:L,D-transpeptidase family protein n=1 Tax=Ideonella sp. A 288 TaxID=1962181 RepID=UPI0018FEF591|nr:L,D-transpeptidase family protein [Ideonella sp. A 288]